ncbi:hypothetical protein ES708_23935 [subsurface metagenome]
MKKLGYINSKRAMEPTFSTWTLQAIYDSNLTWKSGDTLAIRVNGNVVWRDNTTEVGPPAEEKMLYIISPRAELLASLDADLSISDLQRIRTLADRYFLFPKFTGANCDKLVVQEGIKLLWEHEVTGTITDPVTETEYTVDDAPLDGGLIAISPNGEWIAAIVKEAVTGSALVFIYKGS